MLKPFFYPRSALFVPAANERALTKILHLDMDAVIFDLEDSVAEQVKPAAQKNLAAFFSAGHSPAFRQIIRVNTPAQPQGLADLELAAKLGVDAILLPKTEEPAAISRTAALLASRGMAGAALWAMIETPKGILNSAAIAAHPAVTTLVVGPNDIAATTDVSAGENRINLQPWLMQIVLAAKASDCCILDGVCNDFHDMRGFARECTQAAAMGFDGKTLIHPAQIAAANEAFRPTPTAIVRAQAIIAAFREPQNSGKGVIAIDGKMVERLHLARAEKLLRKVGIRS